MNDDIERSIVKQAANLFVEQYCSANLKGRLIRLFSNEKSLEEISAALEELLPQKYISVRESDTGELQQELISSRDKPFFIHKIFVEKLNGRNNSLDAGGCIAVRNDVEVKSKVKNPEIADSLNFVMLIDGSMEIPDSLGPGTFSHVDFDEMLKLLLRKKLDSLSERSVITAVFAAAESTGVSSVSVLGKLTFLEKYVAGKSSIENLGAHLSDIGLINDLGPDFFKRIAQNKHALREIYAKASTSSIQARLQSANVVFGSFSKKLRIYLENMKIDLEPRKWLFEIPSDLTFDKWPIVAQTKIEILDLQIKPFVDESGKLDKGCFLHFEPESGTLIANEKVKVSWTTSPGSVGELGKWKIEIVPVEELRSEFATLRAKTVTASSRSSTVVFNLLEEEKEELAPRYQVRVTALDEDENEVKFSDSSIRKDEIAEALSQEFQIDSTFIEPPELRASKRNIFYSLGHAILNKVHKGISSVSLSNLAYDGAFLTANVISGQKISVPISPLVVDCQSFILEKHQIAHEWSGQSLTGGLIQFNDLSQKELGLPQELMAIRSEVLQRLDEIEGPKIPERLWGDEQFLYSARKYLSIYAEHLEESTGQLREDLLRLETISIRASSINGPVEGLLVLPLHPLRLNWVLEHSKAMFSWSNQLIGETDRKRRSELFDITLANAIKPSNLPFAAFAKFDEKIEMLSYLDELHYGVGLFAEPSKHDQKFALEVLSGVLSPHQIEVQDYGTTQAVTKKIQRYVESHVDTGSLNLVSVNPGEGTLVASVLEELFEDSAESHVNSSRVTTFSKQYSFVNPLRALQELQEFIENQDDKQTDTFLSPTLQVNAKLLNELGEKSLDENVALIEGIADSRIALMNSGAQVATTALKGLIVRTSSSSEDSQSGTRFITFPGIDPLDSSQVELLTAGHRSFLTAVAKSSGAENQETPVLELAIETDTLTQLSLIHSFADWVIAIDPHIGLGIIEVILGKSLIEGFVLDYAPDFIDGVGNRVTVSSSKNSELFKVLEVAMNYVGLLPGGVDAKYLLESLSLASGQLALKLLREDTKAKETIGLAITLAYLRIKGHLKNKIVIPVDSHLNLFGTNMRNADESGERCDLILVELLDNSYRINLVEVKARTGDPESTLPLVMESQVNQTEVILKNRIFENQGETRFDSDLQWARWAGLIRFYAERAKLRSELDSSLYPEIVRMANLIESEKLVPDIQKTGYIVSLNTTKASIPNRIGDMDLVLLNGENLREQGFTTVMRGESQSGFNSEIVETAPTQETAAIPEPDLPAQELEDPDAPQDATHLTRNTSRDATDAFFIELGEEIR